MTYWQSFIPNRPLAPTAAGGIPDAIPAGIPLMQMPLWDDMQAQEDKDPLLEEAIDLSRRQGRASVSMLQRRLRIGYTRACPAGRIHARKRRHRKGIGSTRI